MTILVDINIMLDVFQQRQPFYAKSLTIMNEVMNGALKGICASHGLATLFYMVQKQATTTDAEKAIDEVLQHFEVVGLGTTDWKAARALPMKDFEDAGIAKTAEKAGAAYIVTGSINQACVESGSSEVVRALLAQAEQADVIMAPAADMFEMGVKVQVLKRGTMFAMRAAKLFSLYREFPSLEAIPTKDREMLERQIFQAPLNAIWEQTQAYFAARDASQLTRAEQDPKHKMALVFRWYLGLSSRWANQGDPARKLDYQIWTGPAMGAFNAWTEGSALAQQEHRRVVDVALQLLYGAAYQTRLQWLRQQGLLGRLGSFPPYRPMDREALLRLIASAS